MAKIRTTKTVAWRIDHTYPRRWHPFRFTRTIISTSLVLLALGWWYWDFHRGNKSMYNPGPVSNAHAYFQEKCENCHVGSAKGAYLQRVSDSTCLKCHDGPVHHFKQDKFVSSNDEPTAKSQDCIKCHVEHKGHTVLANLNDAQCTQCHANLKAHLKPNTTSDVTNAVTLFTTDKNQHSGENQHPPFGRKLPTANRFNATGDRTIATFFDQTVIKFGHDTHMKIFPQRPEFTQCYGCHTTSDPSPFATKLTEADSVPTRTSKDRFPSNADASDRRYMQPINYERHCKSCHPLVMSDGYGTPLAHDNMDIIRAQLAQLPAIYSLAIAEDPKKEEKLTITQGTGRKKTTTRMSEDKWPQAVQSQTLNAWLTQIATARKEDPPKEPHPDVASLFPGSATQVSETGLKDFTNAQQLELYAAYGLKDSCAKCHSLEGSLRGLIVGKDHPANPNSATAKLSTVPTGIPSSPRRWFLNSKFNHDKHRSQQPFSATAPSVASNTGPSAPQITCLTCHQVQNRNETSDLMMPGIESCVACHHQPNAHNPGITSTCVSCHLFHDRTRETPPKLQSAP